MNYGDVLTWAESSPAALIVFYCVLGLIVLGCAGIAEKVIRRFVR